MDDFVTIGRWRVPEIRLWAIGGALVVFTGAPVTPALFWVALTVGGASTGEVLFGLLGPVSLLAFAGLTWAVRASPSRLVMRVWAALAWLAFAGPMFVVIVFVLGAAVPRDTPDLVLQVLNVGALLLIPAASSGVAAATYTIARRWFCPRIAANGTR
jgi:hypothetical protein